MIIRAYPALYLGGTPSQETRTSPPSCLLLENRLLMNVFSIARQVTIEDGLNVRLGDIQELFLRKVQFKIMMPV